MRTNRCSVIILLLSIVVVCIIQCEYDGPLAMYNIRHSNVDPPIITQIDPEIAVAGINFITIEGENFSANDDSNGVYIDGHQAEIVDHSTASLKIRRPNCSGDSTAVVIAVFGAIEVARYVPYKIESVYGTYGKFLSGDQLGAVAIDDDENVYVIENNLTNYIYKVTPDGEKTIIGHENSNVYDALITPDGNLITFVREREINFLDIVNGVDTVAVWAEAGKKATHGDFDGYGNLYVSGNQRSDLMVIDPAHNCRALELYPSDEIFWITVSGNYVYVLVELDDPDAANPELAIWRHEILDATGTLGARQLVLDWSATGEYAEATPNTFAVAADNSLLIGTDYDQPILFLDSDWQTRGIAYKDILPTSAEKLICGNGNYLYMILNGESWDLLRIDLGTPEDRDFGE
jgi:dipeptidyl aminopeptidase/acylaminoacyl peptidase